MAPKATDPVLPKVSSLLRMNSLLYAKIQILNTELGGLQCF